MHECNPDSYDEDKERHCNRKKFFSRKNIRLFWRFSKHMKEVFGRDIGVYDDGEEKGVNKTTAELIREQMGEPVESLGA